MSNLFVGILGRLSKASRALSGSFRWVGTLTTVTTQIFTRGLEGSFYSIASLAKIFKAIRNLIGDFHFTPDLTRFSHVQRSISGVFRYAGSLTRIGHLYKSLAGSFRWTGDLTATLIGLTSRSLSGLFYCIGSLTRFVQTYRLLNGSLKWVGNLKVGGKYIKNLGSSLTISSTLVYKMYKLIRKPFPTRTRTLRQAPVMIKDINSPEWKNWFLDLWKTVES